jgi:ABC-type lipoprotein release transport system permease subunit
MKEFTLWVIMALLIAFPVAYLIVSRLLQIYAYRIPIDVWIYLLTGTIALCITLLAVLYQTLRAALTNPARSLQYE